VLEQVEQQLEVTEFDKRDVEEALAAHKKANRAHQMRATLHQLNCVKTGIGLKVRVIYVEYKDINLSHDISNVFRQVGWLVEGPEMFSGGKPPDSSCPVLVQSGDESLADDVLKAIHGGGLIGDLNGNSSLDKYQLTTQVVITLFPKTNS